MSKAWLLLADGTVYEGEGFGAAGERVAELVFTTGMTGTAESLTDPSYAGQMICFTFPQLGNYGIAMDDCESGRVHCAAVIVREYCDLPSNFRCEKTVGALLAENGVVGISGLDTRRITQTIREYGVMNAAVTDAPPTEELLARVRNYNVTGVVAATSVAAPVVLPCPGAKYSVALMDYGYKKSIADCLIKRGCAVTVYPHGTSAETVLAAGHDGVMLSNGPGDPAENVEIIENLKRLLETNIPIFGICLGHQLLSLAIGAKTTKLKYGHRGVNHPVKDLDADRTYITSQNHGYAVVGDSVDPRIARVRYVNLNDGTVEGVEHIGRPVFTVQYHPEVCPGPMDTSYLFDKFIENIEKAKGGAQ